MISSLRLFFALPLSPLVLESIELIATTMQEKARRTGIRVRWTASAQRHVTLRFLGDIHARQLPMLRDCLSSATKSLSGIESELTEVGIFGKERRARVLHLEVRPSSELSLLSTRLEEALAALGFERESRPYHPHVTLGRFRRPTDAMPLLGPQLGLPLTIQLDAVCLYASERRHRAGSTHVELHRSSLERGRPSPS